MLLTNLPQRHIITGMDNTDKVKIFVCKRCGHDWASRQVRPTICPKCKSPYWDKDKVKHDEVKPE